ncbi:ABC transporter permease [Streptomyces sp. x-80]|uniref:ABC transporter permease n=1 Tax=Streptomyces sp. x-80 TaxID=2789282 RepID=UPI003980B77A
MHSITFGSGPVGERGAAVPGEPRESALGPVKPAGFSDAVRFEWLKLRSMKSTMYSLLGAAILIIGPGILSAMMMKPTVSKAMAFTIVFGGMFVGQIVLCVSGALAVTAEYGSGTIQSTFLAVPRRGRLLAAKVLTVFTLWTVAGLAITAVTYVLGRALLPREILLPGLWDATVLRTVIGGAVFIGFQAVFCLALGMLIRTSAGAITAGVCFVLVLPTLMGVMGVEAFTKAWPTERGKEIFSPAAVDGIISSFGGLIYFCVFTIALFSCALLWVRHRDV